MEKPPPEVIEHEPDEVLAGEGVAGAETGVPEADVIEQSQPVEEEPVVELGRSRAEASEADWYEQSIEVIDEEADERR